MQTLYYPDYGELAIRHLPSPCIEHPSDVLLTVLACGICGSELETFRSKSKRRAPPLIMGHEFCGIVSETGDAVTAFKKGDYVVSNSIISCNNCSYCEEGLINLCESRQVFGMHRNGAFAQTVNVPSQCILPLPGHIDYKAACLIEPLANAVHILNMLAAFTRDPVNVLIIGAGSMGLLILQALKCLQQSIIVVADINEERLRVADRLGADYVVNSSKTDLPDFIDRFSGHRGMDVAIDAVGNAVTTEHGLRIIKPGGVLVMVGLAENNSKLLSYDIILREKKIMGSYAAVRQDLETAVELIASGNIDVTSWVQYYSLAEGKQAFEDMLDARYIKAVILPNAIQNYA